MRAKEVQSVKDTPRPGRDRKYWKAFCSSLATILMIFMISVVPDRNSANEIAFSFPALALIKV